MEIRTQAETNSWVHKRRLPNLDKYIALQRHYRRPD